MWRWCDTELPLWKIVGLHVVDIPLTDWWFVYNFYFPETFSEFASGFLYFFQPEGWSCVNRRWLRSQIYLGSWFYFCLSSVANQLSFIPQCLCMVLWRRRLLAYDTGFCWHKPTIFASCSSSKLIYSDSNFQIKVKPNEQSLLHHMLTGSFEHFWTSFIYLSASVVHQVVHLCKGGLWLSF